MEFRIRDDNLAAEIVVFTVLVFIFQVMKYVAPVRFVVFIDFVLSLLLGLILSYSAVYLFGAYRKKIVLTAAIILTVAVLVFLGMHSVLHTFFVVLGVLFALISLSDNLIKDILKKERKKLFKRS